MGKKTYVEWILLFLAGSFAVGCVGPATGPGTDLESPPTAPTAVGNEDEGELPKTCDDAALFLSKRLDEESRDYLRHTPYWDLIQFHHGFGTGIRNSFGLWGGNPELLASCADKVGRSEIHPDTASGIIIESLWELINGDLPKIDWDSMDPEAAFTKIDEILTDAFVNQNNRMLITLPQWVFKPDSFAGQRSERHSQVARKLAQSKSKLAYIALLYLSYFPSSDDNHLFEALLKSAEPNFHYPFMRGGLTVSRFRIADEDLDSNIEVKGPQRFFWREYSLGELALDLLGERYGSDYYQIVRFKSVEDYEKWKKLLDENPMFKWSKKSRLDLSLADEMCKTPVDLLKILLLTDGYVEPRRSSEDLPIETYRSSRKLFERFIEILPKRDKRPRLISEEHYSWEARCGYACESTPTTQEICWRPCPQLVAMEALTRLAATASADDLLDAISSESHRQFLAMPFSETLRPFHFFAYFLILSEFDRLNKLPFKDRLWNACEHFIHSKDVPWQDGWDIWPTLLSLQFEVDSVRTDRRVRDIFELSQTFADCEGDTIRYLYLDMMVKERASQYLDIVEEWYRKRKVGCENTEDSEAGHILSDLRSGPPIAKELWEKLSGKSLQEPTTEPDIF